MPELDPRFPATPQEHTGTPGPAIGLEQLLTPVWIYDTRNFRVHWANASALKLWRAESLKELTARDFRPQMSEAIYNTLLAYLQEFEAGKSINRWWQLSPKGLNHNVFCRFSGIRLEDGHMAMLCEGLEEGAIDRDSFSGHTTLVSMYDSHSGVLLSHNPAFAACYGGSIHCYQDLFDEPGSASRLLRQVRDQQSLQLDVELSTPHGRRWHYMELRLAHDDLRPDTLLVMQLDISTRKQAEFDQRHLAETDALTGLLNRHAVLRQLTALTADPQPFALLYIDLDGFKLINDTFGHSLGDALLKRVAERIRDSSPENCCLARFGGDEFILAAPLEDSGGAPAEFAAQLIEVISRPYQVSGFGNLNIGASIGIALYPQQARNPHDLIANADTAMYAAKSRGRMRHALFSPDIHNTVRRRTMVVQGLHDSLQQGAFNLHYQPVYDPQRRRLPGVEALLRWEHPVLGPVAADEAIAAAEESGLIKDLDRWVWKHACLQLRQWHQAGHRHLHMGVNVSGKHVLQDDFIEALVQQVRNAGLSPRDLILELTETATMMDIEGNIDLFQELKQLGFQLAIDDFGTGYSSLAYLHQLPVDILKIDRSFINRLAEDRHSVYFVRDLARAQGKRIVAEGVEEVWQYQILRELGIRLMQGYLFARPMPAADLQAVLANPARLDPGADDPA